MATIWKYPIPVADEFELDMPQNAELLFVETQNGQGCLWARVQPEKDIVARKFKLRGTGHTVDMDCDHVGSFLLHSGQIVFHLFAQR